MATTFFCPFRGRADQQDNRCCTRCGRSLRHRKENAWEERRILTLRHPLREHRMMAIRVPGAGRYGRTTAVSAAMIARGKDTPESSRLPARVKKHPFPVVRSIFSGTAPGTKAHGGELS